MAHVAGVPPPAVRARRRSSCRFRWDGRPAAVGHGTGGAGGSPVTRRGTVDQISRPAGDRSCGNGSAGSPMASRDALDQPTRQRPVVKQWTSRPTDSRPRSSRSTGPQTVRRGAVREGFAQAQVFAQRRAGVLGAVDAAFLQCGDEQVDDVVEAVGDQVRRDVEAVDARRRRTKWANLSARPAGVPTWPRCGPSAMTVSRSDQPFASAFSRHSATIVRGSAMRRGAERAVVSRRRPGPRVGQRARRRRGRRGRGSTAAPAMRQRRGGGDLLVADPARLLLGLLLGGADDDLGAGEDAQVVRRAAGGRRGGPGCRRRRPARRRSRCRARRR